VGMIFIKDLEDIETIREIQQRSWENPIRKKTSNLLKGLRQSSVDFITNSIELKITILQYDGESINLKLLSI